MSRLRRILEELSNQYMIGYESKNTSRNGSWREVKLEIPGTSYAVRARQGYRARDRSHATFVTFNF